jgi:hypothetical protein
LLKIGKSVSEFTKKPLVIILATLFMIIGTLVAAATTKGIDASHSSLIFRLEQ